MSSSQYKPSISSTKRQKHTIMKMKNICLTIFLVFLASHSVKAATVPASERFQYVNQGVFGEYTVEYMADYRVVSIPSSFYPFVLCFYNTTPNAFTLAIRMGDRHTESIMRWVWDANRGNPVKENATLTFGKDGNLVLAEADGTVAWQTNTANKNVIGLTLAENGNLVLYDKKGNFVWQSFDYPTDTILVGQTLKATGPRLVSRVSAQDGSPGPYSYGLERNLMTLKYHIKNAKQFYYYYKSIDFGGEGHYENVTFDATPEYDSNDQAFDLGLIGINARPNYNATYSMLRVGYDGNLRIYTFDPNVTWRSWETTFTLFREEENEDTESECSLPRHCGAMGVCKNRQCVACPRPQGLLGWDEECLPPVLPPCKGGANVEYYKVVGAEHFSSRFNDGIGPIKVADCQKKCDSDCKCLGFFYKAESSKCLVVPELGTIVKVSNTSHVAYIKKSK